MLTRMPKTLKFLLTLTIAVYGFGDIIKRERSALREGPGPWYPMILELNEGTEVMTIENQGNWWFVEYEARRGYVSQRAFKGKEKRTDVFSKMGMSSTGKSISHAGVTAAVKGFAQRFSRHLNADYSQLDHFRNSLITPHSFQEFKNITVDLGSKPSLDRIFSLGSQESTKAFSFAEEGSGLAIALKLSSMWLLVDPEAIEYVNHVGILVAEQSHGFDIKFRFHIIDSPAINGYACPGGIIFITLGALEAMESEAELACFLGHEIAHVSRLHGLEEMEYRKVQIKAGNAVDAMNQAFGEEQIDQDILELEQVAISSYERIFNGRLSEYEEEADKLGLLYAARAGYDPNSMIDFLNRLEITNISHESDHYSVEENQIRIKRLKRMLAEQRWKNPLLFQNYSQRFLKMSEAINTE